MIAGNWTEGKKGERFGLLKLGRGTLQNGDSDLSKEKGSCSAGVQPAVFNEEPMELLIQPDL